MLEQATVLAEPSCIRLWQFCLGLKFMKRMIRIVVVLQSDHFIPLNRPQHPLYARQLRFIFDHIALLVQPTSCTRYGYNIKPICTVLLPTKVHKKLKEQTKKNDFPYVEFGIYSALNFY
jgi:hypothetical protein